MTERMNVSNETYNCYTLIISVKQINRKYYFSSTTTKINLKQKKTYILSLLKTLMLYIKSIQYRSLKE